MSTNNETCEAVDPIIQLLPDPDSTIVGEEIRLLLEFFDTDAPYSGGSIDDLQFQNATDASCSLAENVDENWRYEYSKACSIVFGGYFAVSDVYQAENAINKLGLVAEQNFLRGSLLAILMQDLQLEVQVEYHLLFVTETNLQFEFREFDICSRVRCGYCQKCLDGICVTDPLVKYCSDEDPMTTPDRCNAAGVCSGEVQCIGVQCGECFACAVDEWGSSCQRQPDGTACDDGKFASRDGKCQRGTCIGAAKDECHCNCPRNECGTQPIMGCSCDQTVGCGGRACCASGYCNQEQLDFPSCTGGRCNQDYAHYPSCNGGLCSQYGATSPSCNAAIGCFGNCDFRELIQCECKECSKGTCSHIPLPDGTPCHFGKGTCAAGTCSATRNCYDHDCDHGSCSKKEGEFYKCTCEEAYVGEHCEYLSSCPKLAVANGEVTLRLLGTTLFADLVCDPFYEKESGSPVTCPLGGEWSRQPKCTSLIQLPEDCVEGEEYVDEECVALKCPVFEVEHGSVTFEAAFGWEVLEQGTVATMSCERPYFPFVSSVTTSLCYEGAWSDPPATCVRHEPLEIENLVVTSHVTAYIRNFRAQLNIREEDLEVVEVSLATHSYDFLQVPQNPVVPFASENVALGQPAAQSSTVFPAGRAVDGNVNASLEALSYSRTAYELHAWWRVDFPQARVVARVVIHNGFNVTSRLAPFTLEVGRWSRMVTTVQKTYDFRNLFVPMVTQVTISALWISLAEVQVFGWPCEELHLNDTVANETAFLRECSAELNVFCAQVHKQEVLIIAEQQERIAQALAAFSLHGVSAYACENCTLPPAAAPAARPSCPGPRAFITFQMFNISTAGFSLQTTLINLNSMRSLYWSVVDPNAAPSAEEVLAGGGVCSDSITYAADTPREGLAQTFACPMPEGRMYNLWVAIDDDTTGTGIEMQGNYTFRVPNTTTHGLLECPAYTGLDPAGREVQRLRLTLWCFPACSSAASAYFSLWRLLAEQPALLSARFTESLCLQGAHCSREVDACSPCHAPCLGANVTCADLPGQPANEHGRTCSCIDPGQEYVEYVGCVDQPVVNETGNASVCADVPRPSPAAGHDCVCPRGSEPVGDRGCREVDDVPAAEGGEVNACISFPCGPFASCVDLVRGSEDARDGRFCVCPPGMELDGDGCVNVNGCANVTCGSDEVCRSLPPPEIGHECVCAPGAVGDPCVDIDECAIHNPCHPENGRCLENEGGGWRCACWSMFAGTYCDSECSWCGYGGCNQTECDKPMQCRGGGCDQSGAHNSTCPGGGCNQSGSQFSTCNGGGCDQTKAHLPTCNGGNCIQVHAYMPECNGCGCTQTHAYQGSCPSQCESCPGNCEFMTFPSCESCYYGNVFPDPGRDGQACDDGDPFTILDKCENGSCRGSPTFCSTISCNPCHTCSNALQECVVDDTNSELCADCEDCSWGVCSAAAANGQSCDDGIGNTHHEICNAGTCRGLTCQYQCDTPGCDQRSLQRPCCDAGNCTQTGAVSAMCVGGYCDQRNSDACYCNGGHCDQTGCTNPECRGGSCVGNCAFITCEDCHVCVAGACIPANDIPCTSPTLHEGTCAQGVCVGLHINCFQHDVLCPDCQHCVDGACVTNPRRQYLPCSHYENSVCEDGACVFERQPPEVISSIRVFRVRQVVAVDGLAVRLVVSGRSAALHPYKLARAFRVKAGDPAALTLDADCTPAPDALCAQNWTIAIDLPFRASRQGQLVEMVFTAVEHGGDTEVTLNYDLHLGVGEPFFQIINRAPLQGSFSAVAANNSYVPGATIHFTLAMAGDSKVSTQYLTVMAGTKVFRALGSGASEVVAKQLRLNVTSQGQALQYSMFIHRILYADRTSPIVTILVRHAVRTVSPGRRRLSNVDQEPTYVYETNFQVNAYFCDEPYGYEVLPGTHHEVPCEGGEGRWYAFCSLEGWDLNRSHGLDTCELVQNTAQRNETEDKDEQNSDQQAGFPFYGYPYWLVCGIAAGILLFCILLSCILIERQIRHQADLKKLNGSGHVNVCCFEVPIQRFKSERGKPRRRGSHHRRASRKRTSINASRKSKASHSKSKEGHTSERTRPRKLKKSNSRSGGKTSRKSSPQREDQKRKSLETKKLASKMEEQIDKLTDKVEQLIDARLLESKRSASRERSNSPSRSKKSRIYEHGSLRKPESRKRRESFREDRRSRSPRRSVEPKPRIRRGSMRRSSFRLYE